MSVQSYFCRSPHQSTDSLSFKKTHHKTLVTFKDGDSVQQKGLGTTSTIPGHTNRYNKLQYNKSTAIIIWISPI